MIELYTDHHASAVHDRASGVDGTAGTGTAGTGTEGTGLSVVGPSGVGRKGVKGVMSGSIRRGNAAHHWQL